MIGEISVLCMLFGFCQSHEWRERPVWHFDVVGVGTKNEDHRHVQGFYPDGTNSGYFKNGIHTDDTKNLDKYGKHFYGNYKPRTGEMCRYPDIMKQAEKNVASSFTADKYKAGIIGKSHNCQDYKKAVNAEYTRLHSMQYRTTTQSEL